MNNLLSKIANNIDPHTLEVMRKSSASSIVRAAGMVVGLIVSIFLGRTLGPEGLGIISLANQITGLLLILIILGMDNVLVKQISIAFERKKWQTVSDSLYTALRINIPIAATVTIIILIFSSLISQRIFHNSKLEIPLIITVVVLLPRTLSRIYASGLNGFRKIWQSSLVNETMSTWVVGFGLLIMVLLKIEITVINAAFLYAIGGLVVTFSIVTYWKKLFKFSGKSNWIPGPMLNMALPLLLVSTVSIVTASSDIIMLGWLSNTHEVGLYTVAVRLSLLMSFFLIISNSAITPKLASLFADKKIEQMSKMVKNITGGLIIIALLFLIIFILAGHTILSLWGHDFKDAYLILIILSMGQLFNMSTGCAGMMLIMCGFEKLHGYISLIILILNLILNFFLIKEFGAVGAAAATAISVGSENIIKVIFAKKKVGILTIPFIN